MWAEKLTVHPFIGTPRIFAEVLFGTAKAGCKGSGICRIYTTIGARRLQANQRRVPVIITILLSGQPAFWIKKKDLTEELRREVLTGDTFLMEEGFSLCGSIAYGLGKEILRISPGPYPVREANEWLLIDFSRQK